MTRAVGRLRLVTLVQEAVAAGARLGEACRCIGMCERTLQRWQQTPDDRRPQAPRPEPKNKLSAEEVQQVLDICHEPRFASLPPSQIVPTLADEDRYIASESTFYRVLHRAGEMTRRGRQKAAQSRPLSTWKATAPRQVWTWDITWLKSLTAGHWYYLYLIEDVFSRKIVGYEVHQIESGENAAELLKRTVLSECCWQEPLVLHADNAFAQPAAGEQRQCTCGIAVQDAEIRALVAGYRVRDACGSAGLGRKLRWLVQRRTPTQWDPLRDARSAASGGR